MWSMLPHTHVRGKRWIYDATYPDGRKETLLSVPNYDFNWQTDYVFKQPLKLPKGTKIHATAWYDNSTANKSNPDPTKDVWWGDQTWEEMMFTGLTFSIDPRQAVRTPPVRDSRASQRCGAAVEMLGPLCLRHHPSIVPGVYSAPVTTLRARCPPARVWRCIVSRRPPPPRAAFSVGVLRRDGVVIPFAAFDGKRWSNDWPPPAPRLHSHRLCGRARRAGGDRRAAASPGRRGPGSIRACFASCSRTGLTRTAFVRLASAPTTARRSGAAAPASSRIRRTASRFRRPQPVERIAIVRRTPTRRAGCPRRCRKHSTRPNARVDRHYGHPIVETRARRARPGHRSGLCGRRHPRIYYVEATRRYRLLGQTANDCEAVAFGTGWFARDGVAVRSLDMAVDLLPCDRRGASYMLPLGAMRVADKLFWLAQFSGWNHERYVVVEFKPRPWKRSSSTWGGSC